jgi:glycosyltransferase involved in cell wall biosynthesis
MKNKLKILMLSPQFRPIVGGYERAAERLSGALGQLGHVVTVLAERRNPAWPSKENGGGYTLERFWCLHRPRLHIASSLVGMALFLLRYGRRFNLFHVHQYGVHAALAVLFGKLLCRPVVLKLTNTKAQSISRTLNSHSSIGRWLLTRLHRRIDACVATSQEAVADAIAFGIPAARVHLIPNGIDTNAFCPPTATEKEQTKAMLGLGNGPLVLYCGRLYEPKNPMGLLNAWDLIHLRFPEATLCFIGDGPLRQTMQERTENQILKNSVQLIGQVSDVLDWYKAADLFALPSHFEGLSNSLLEAMSCGLPVVSTQVSGSMDIFEKADIGEMVEVGDMQAFAEATIRLLKHTGRLLVCSYHARQEALTRYSLRHVAERTEQLYRQLLQ